MIRYGDRDKNINVHEVIKSLGADFEMKPDQFWKWIYSVDLKLLDLSNIEKDSDGWMAK